MQLEGMCIVMRKEMQALREENEDLRNQLQWSNRGKGKQPAQQQERKKLPQTRQQQSLEGIRRHDEEVRLNNKRTEESLRRKHTTHKRGSSQTEQAPPPDRESLEFPSLPTQKGSPAKQGPRPSKNPDDDGFQLVTGIKRKLRNDAPRVDEKVARREARS